MNKIIKLVIFQLAIVALLCSISKYDNSNSVLNNHYKNIYVIDPCEYSINPKENYNNTDFYINYII